MNGAENTRWTLALSWGPSGGFYLHPHRICLGHIALTFLPRVEIDDLMETYVAASGVPEATSSTVATRSPFGI
jgi:hypothetical protein